jgi:tetratricopeptide (TPR) repeat protein
VKPGRNDPCPCGSGRKYKHCCGVLPGSAAAGGAVQLQPAVQPPSAGQAAELPDDPAALRSRSAALLDRGQLAEALASLRRLLELQPRDVQVLMATANALCALGRAREAVPLHQAVLQINPRLSEAQNNLGNAFQELGENAAAVGCYRAALAVNADDAETHCNLSNALRQLGQLDEAIGCGQRAIALEPGLSLAHNNLGLALAARGRGPEALASFRQAVTLNPRFVEALSNLGNALRERGEHVEALVHLRTAVELRPQRAESHYNLGTAQYAHAQVAQSLASFRAALALRPDYPAGQVGLATALRLHGQASEAEDSCRSALAAHPDDVSALCLLGDLHADRGDFQSAQELLQRALTINADAPAVYCSIAAHRKMTRADAGWLAGVEALLAKPLVPQHEIGLRFALGKYYDDVRQYDDAFSQYRSANELSKRYQTHYDRGQLSQQVDRIIGSFDGAFLRESHAGASASELPVFIIGMPRSGTSLTEQILASHPQVFGAGEPVFWDSAFTVLQHTGHDGADRASAFASMARDYLAQVTRLAGAARRVVDKLPGNFLYAGLIHAVFPRAKILHMQRDPIDTCLSLYFQNFSTLHPYAADLDDLVHYYGEYLRLMNHWRRLLPATTLLEIPYEALIADQEGWSRRIVNFIALPWHPQCLDFHQTQRVVITASRWQVRQRLNAASVGRWRNYEKHVAPLRRLVAAAS